MNIPFRIIFLFSMVLYLVDVTAQSDTVDSLKRILQTHKEDQAEVNALLSLGQIYENENHLDSAIITFQEALRRATAINDKRSEATALMYLGGLTGSLGNYGEAIELLFRSSNLYEQISDPDGTIEVQMPLEGTYREAGDYNHALKHALNVKARVEKTDKRGVIIFRGIRIFPLVLAEIGETYQHMNKLDSAEYYTKKAIDEQLMFNGATWNFPIYLLGKIQAKQGKFGEALKNYKSAIPLAIKNGILKDTLDIYNSISELYKNTGELDSAIYYGKSIIGKRVLNIKILLKAITTLADVYKLRHNTDSAFKYLELSSALKDSIYSTEKQQQFQSATFNEQLRQQESVEQQEELRGRMLIYALVGGLIAFLIIALLLYRNNLQKQNANVKIEKAFDELKATQKQLIQSEKMASLGELTAGIAHEIQNPLNFVNNFSDINTELIGELKKELGAGDVGAAEALTTDIEDNEQKINHHGRRADAIVKNMLLHSRTSSGQKAPADINALCDEYMRLAYHGYRAKHKSLPAGQAGFNVKIETDFDPALPKVNIVLQDIGRVVLNLVNNAFYAVTEMKGQAADGYEPSVRLITKSVSGKVEISIKDNGIGIPETVKEKIFQPFFTTKPTGLGTGLGLSLSYDIVKAHGGTLEVISKQRVGSEFIIQLPT